MTALFSKQNRSRYADQLLKEALGLKALREVAVGTGIDVPEVLDVNQQTLTLQLIRTRQGSPDQWARLGRGLASIHESTNARFGLDEDNYIGLNPQPNPWTDSWGEFFLKQRLGFQVGIISDPERRQQFSEHLGRVSARLREFLDAEPISPSFLHGDLWNGNVLFDEDGRVWMIDPAPYFGDSDADLAMSEMFGGFAAEFYAAYRAIRPAYSTYPLKKRIYNLYHALNHLNLFGSSYLTSCEEGFAILETI